MSNFILHTYEFLMVETYERIISGKPYDSKFKIYDNKLINNTIEYFEKREEFEKCSKLLDFLKSRSDHEKNYFRL